MARRAAPPAATHLRRFRVHHQRAHRHAAHTTTATRPQSKSDNAASTVGTPSPDLRPPDGRVGPSRQHQPAGRSTGSTQATSNGSDPSRLTAPGTSWAAGRRGSACSAHRCQRAKRSCCRARAPRSEFDRLCYALSNPTPQGICGPPARLPADPDRQSQYRNIAKKFPA